MEAGKGLQKLGLVHANAISKTIQKSIYAEKRRICAVSSLTIVV